MIDPLTGCFNQNYFEKKFKIDNFNPNSDRNKIALVYVDLNDLKSINDTPENLGGGHKVGDEYIKRTAELLESNFREDDIIIRLHGDEFLVICRDRKDGINDGELRARVDSIRKLAIDQSPSLSFATGVAVFDDVVREDGLDLGLCDTEIRAEQDMYRCKEAMKSGR
jgi:diguanylate cyclase (GGDEF)-like protein